MENDKLTYGYIKSTLGTHARYYLIHKVCNAFPSIYKYIEESFIDINLLMSWHIFLKQNLHLLSDIVDLELNPSISCLYDYIIDNKLDDDHYVKIIHKNVLWKYSFDKDHSIYYFYNLITKEKCARMIFINRNMIHTSEAISNNVLTFKEALRFRKLIKSERH